MKQNIKGKMFASMAKILTICATFFISLPCHGNMYEPKIPLREGSRAEKLKCR